MINRVKLERRAERLHGRSRIDTPGEIVALVVLTSLHDGDDVETVYNETKKHFRRLDKETLDIIECLFSDAEE